MVRRSFVSEKKITRPTKVEHKGLACKETVEQFAFGSLDHINQGEWELLTG
jgi:hypothetical protein